MDFVVISTSANAAHWQEFWPSRADRAAIDTVNVERDLYVVEELKKKKKKICLRKQAARSDAALTRGYKDTGVHETENGSLTASEPSSPDDVE
jgi:hypothetical protein